MAEIAVRDDNNNTSKKQRKKMKRVKAKELCSAPVKIVGVQDKTPLCWDESGTRFAFVSNNRSIYIWERKTTSSGSYRMVLRQVLRGGHKHTVLCTIFDPNFADTKTIVSGGGDGIIIWDVATGEIKKKLPLTSELGQNFHSADIECLKFCHGGAYLLSGSKDNSIKIWDVKKDYALLDTLNGHKAPVLALDFNESKQLIGSAGRDSTVKVWDASTLNPAVRAKRVDDRGENVQLKCSMDGHRGDVCALSFFNNGDNLISGARDNTMKIWSIDLAREEREVKGKVHNADVRRIIFINPDENKEGKQYFASAGLDGLIKVWLLGSIDDVAGLQSVEDQALGAKQTLADIMSDQAVAVLSHEEGVPDSVVGEVQAHEVDVWAMEIANSKTDNGEYIVASCTLYNEICFWQMTMKDNGTFAFRCVQKYIGHREQLTSMQLIGEKNLITSSCDYSCHLYDLETMECKAEYDFGGAALSATVTRDNKYLLVGGTEYDIKMYALTGTYNRDKNGHCRPVAYYKGHSGRVISLASKIIGNVNILASGGHDFDICLWEVKDGLGAKNNKNNNNNDLLEDEYDDGDFDDDNYYEPLKIVPAHEGHVMDLQFSEEMDYLASGGNDHCVKCWEYKNKNLILKWKNRDTHDSVVTSVCWGKGESMEYIFSASWDSNIYAWHYQEGANGAQAKLSAHTNRVTEVETSPEGKYLYSCGADFRTYVWQATGNFQCLCQYRTSGDGVISTLSTGTNFTCTGDSDGLIRVWPSYGNSSYSKNFEKYHERRLSLMSIAQSTDDIDVDKMKSGEEEKVMESPPDAYDKKSIDNNANQQQQQQMQQQQQSHVLNIQVPPGAQPGQVLQVQTPKGVVQVQIPAGMQPGQAFQIQV